MTSEAIHQFILAGKFPGRACVPELVETHISWVILCGRFAYKIKKPIRYSFLDFSTLDRRKVVCEREVVLNRRLTKDMYLGVEPVKQNEGHYFIGADGGEIVDYAVVMRKQDPARQMDRLLARGQVSATDLANLAGKIADFHKKTSIIITMDVRDVQEKFNDLQQEQGYLHDVLNKQSAGLISRAVEASDSFMNNHEAILHRRLRDGCYRDCHGDLHSRNIFLVQPPQVFDCIEFNDDLRQIDVLNEIAFLCMDLDAFGRQDLSGSFLDFYNKVLPCIKTEGDKRLFIYYKSYRSNVRAKVNSLRARSARNATEQLSALRQTEKYLQLMDAYLQLLR